MTIAEFVVDCVLNTDLDIDQCRDKLIEKYVNTEIDSNCIDDLKSRGFEVEGTPTTWDHLLLNGVYNFLLDDIPELN